MSSKIIKSSQLKITQPKTIIPDLLYAQSETAEEQDETGESLLAELAENEPKPAAEIARQADEILKETEDMVKELMATARSEAEKIISEAREEAQKNIDESVLKAQKIQQEAFEDSNLRGYTEGKNKAEVECRALRDEAQKVLEDAYLEKEKIIQSADGELLKLVTAVAQKVIQKELQTDPTIILDIVRQALQKVNDREELTLMVSPENLDNIINEQDEILHGTKGVKKMKIVADPEISPGGCVIETTNGSVDARVERQLEEIEQTLMDVTDGG